MANDSTNAGQVSSEQDTTPINDGYFAEGDGDDFFGPEQLAQAGTGGAPVVVPVPQDQNVIRVQVNPGEILELSPPFDGGAALLGREDNGNLAIKVGDVTVILVGFVEANAQAPIIVETSDGQPIDIATLLASTDPTIDIQTAAGPGDAAAGAQGADNTGAFFGQLGAGAGLGGLNAVGAQDGTQLSYGLIDNSIRLDREDALLALAGTSFRGLAEPFLRDPFNNTTFADFTSFFTNYKTDVDGTGDAWADFTGTAANGIDFESYLEQTAFTNVVTHTSTLDEPLSIDCDALALQLAGMTSNQHALYIDPATVDMTGHATTVFVRREGDDALILVIHAHAAGNGLSDDTSATSGDFQIDTYLINRLDHPDQGQDILDLDIPYDIRNFVDGQEEITFTPGSVQVQVQDDIPITGETDYYSFLHACSFKDAADCFSAFLGGKITDYVVTNDAGHVDEDYLFHGNRDKDNALGPDSDEARGDDIGDKFVVGMLNINFGADGPSGKIPEGDKPSKTDPVFKDATPPALAIAGLNAGDAYPDATSHGHDLVVLKHEKLPFPFSTVEIVQVGYTLDVTPSETLAKTSEGYGDVVVFTLLLQTGPNLPLFGGFVFEQCAPLDHPLAATLESNLPLNFQVIATDDDGDHPVDPVTISIQVNDDAPTFLITYNNEDPRNCDVREDFTFSLSGGDGNGYCQVDHYTTKDFGHVDEDWLKGGGGNSEIAFANGQGNHDQDGFGNDNANLYGDDKGGLDVCGQIKVKFGADGPSDAPGNGELALKTYVIPVSGPEPVFVNGDGKTLTSDGKPLVVLESDSGHLLVGTAPFIIPGGGPEGSDLIVPGQKVFELSLNPNTGKFEFHLWGAIDHVPSTVDGQPESNLVLSFNVGAATDFDGDQALGAINIKVNDDKPEVGITYYNELPGEIIYGISVSDGLPIKKDTDFGRIDEDWLQGAGGNTESLTLVASGNHDRDYFGTSNANQFGDDYGSSHVSGQINARFGADGPGTQSIGLATLAAATDADGNALTTQGGTVSLVVLHSASDEIRIGYADENGDHTVFLLTLDQYGHFDFTQFEPIDHPIASPIEDNVYLTFNAGSITDGDGDTVEAVIKIQVNDDTPATGVKYVNNDDYSSTTVGIVDEDHVLSGVGNKDADSTPGDTDGKGAVFFDLFAGGFGADGPGGSQPIGFTAQENDTFTVKDDNGDPHTLTTADGHEVLAHAEDNGVGGFTLIGYFNSNGSEGFVDGSSTEVFTLAYNSDNNSGQFNLLQSLKHPLPNEDNLFLSFGIKTGLTDGDGDPAVATINIKVNDDGPQAVDENLTATDGNIFNNGALKGGDGAKVTSVSGHSGTFAVTDGSPGIVTDANGSSLVLYADGTWAFSPFEGNGNGTFTYTITDGDGDTSTATLTFAIATEPSSARLASLEVGPTHEPAPHYDHDVTVTGLNGIANPFTSQTYHFEDPTGGHLISGGAGNDYINVTGGVGAILSGNGGDDIIHGGNGASILKGGAGDDTLFGGTNADSFFGDAGHDAMSGGDGNDTFHKVDADDLDGTNTLDGTHSIDGGAGTDTVDLSVLKSFDSSQAIHLENVEHLALEGKAAGGGGTAVTLSYDAAYGITEVGGLHQLSITGDKADTVHLLSSGGNTWSEIGSSHVYEAGIGAAKITVTVDQDCAVQVS